VITEDKEAANKEKGDNSIYSYDNPSDINVVELAFEEGVI
jgi:hypothetical protein